MVSWKKEPKRHVGLLPDRPSDAFWFAVAPVTTVPISLYGAASFFTGQYPFGKVDWRENARNTVLWGGIAAAVYGWNLLASPHNAVFISGSNAFRTAAYLAGTAMIPTAIAATAVAAGVYVHTSDAPTEAHRSEPGETSWWRSVAQAMAGTGWGAGSFDL